MEFIGRYRIVEPLGFGGSGTVYKCVDPDNGCEVAIKMFAPPQSTSITAITQMLDRFKKESQLLASLNHPNIVKMIDYGQVEGQPFIVLEFVNVCSKKSFTPEETLDVLLQTTKALQFSHSKNIIHRDIKPENILVSDDGGKLSVKLSDFGIAYVGDQTVRMTRPGEFVGTFAYMSPEQIASEVPDATTDIYSLGLVAYEYITGKKVFDGQNPAQIISQIMMANPKPPSKIADNIPHSFDRIIMKMIRKDKFARFQTTSELLASLEELKQVGLGGMSETKDIIKTTLFSPLVGRDDELLMLSRSLNDAMSGKMQFRFLLGPTGIGKTRLAQELSSMARAWGMKMLTINLINASIATPYGLVRLIAEQIWERNIPPEHALGLAALSPAIAYDLKISIPEIRPSEIMGLISGAFSWLLANAASSIPLYLHIDDFQNCDNESAEIMTKIIEKQQNSKTLLVFTVNTDHLLADSKSLSPIELAKKAGYSLTLGHLNDQNIKRMIEASLGYTDIPEELTEFVSKESVGNPLMASEMLKAFLGAGIIEIRDDKVTIKQESLALPDDLAMLQTMMIGNINAVAREILRIASIVGQSFSAELVSAVAEKSIFDVLSAFEEGLNHQILRMKVTKRGNIYSFSHERFRQSLEDTVDIQRKQIIHEKTAQTMQVLYSDSFDAVLDEYIKHLLGGLDPSKAIPYLLKSANVGFNMFQDQEAIAKADKAIELAKEIGDHLSVLKGMKIKADIGKNHSRFNQSLDICNEAILYYDSHSVDDIKMFAVLLRVKGILLLNVGKMDESTESFKKVLELIGENGDPVELVYIYTNLAGNYRRTDINLATDYALKALDLSRKTGDPLRIISALTSYGQMLRTQGHFKEAILQLEQAVVIGETKGLGMFITQTYSNLAPMYFLDMGDFEKGSATAEKSRTIAKKTNNFSQLAYLNLVEGYAAKQVGNYEKSINLYTEAIEVFEKTGELPKLMSTVAFLGEVYLSIDDYVKGRECLNKAKEIQQKLGTTFPAWDVVNLEVFTLLGEGNPLEAENVIKSYMESVPKSAKNVGVENSVKHAHAEIEIAKGDYKQAIHILRELSKEIEASDNLSYKAHTFVSFGDLYIRILEKATKMSVPKRILHFASMGLLGKDIAKLADEALDKAFLYAIEQNSIRWIVHTYTSKTKLDIYMAKLSDGAESITHLKYANENLWKAMALNADMPNPISEKVATELMLELSELQH